MNYGIVINKPNPLTMRFVYSKIFYSVLIPTNRMNYLKTTIIISIFIKYNT